MTSASLTIVNQLLQQIGFELPINIVANIGSFLDSPKQIVKIREVSKGLNSMITKTTNENRVFWQHHGVARWGNNYVQCSFNNLDHKIAHWEHKYVEGGIQDLLFLYAQLDQLEKAALQHLSLETEGQIHLFDYNANVCSGIAAIAMEYLKGPKANPAWRYFLGMNTLGKKFESALLHLLASGNKGYKKSEDRFEIALKWLSKASKTDGEAKVILEDVISGKLPEKEIGRIAFKFHLDKLSQMSLSQESDNKNSACGSNKTIAMPQNIPPLPIPVDVFNHIFSFFKPKQLASCRAISQLFNTLILENTESNKLVWDGHCAVRWGINYIPSTAKGDYECVHDKISLYGNLYRLEKVALRHLTLLDQALWDDKFSDLLEINMAIYNISERYVQGAYPKVAWLYLYGKNLMEANRYFSLKGSKHLEIAAKQGYKDAAAFLGKWLLYHSPLDGVNWLLKAKEQNHPVANQISLKDLLQAIKNGWWDEYAELQQLSLANRYLCLEALRQGIKRKNEEDANELEPPAKKPKLENTKS